MSTITPEELLRLWRLEEITPEMAIGHLIQNLVKQQKAQAAMKGTLSQLSADVNRLITHTKMPAATHK